MVCTACCWTLSSIFEQHGVIILFVYCLLQVVYCISHTLLLLATLFEQCLIILLHLNSNLRKSMRYWRTDKRRNYHQDTHTMWLSTSCSNLQRLRIIAQFTYLNPFAPNKRTKQASCHHSPQPPFACASHMWYAEPSSSWEHPHPTTNSVGYFAHPTAILRTCAERIH